MELTELWGWSMVNREHWNLLQWFCKKCNVFRWLTEILLWLNFQSWKHRVKLSWQMQIPEKIWKGRCSLLCFDIFPSLLTTRAWDHLRASPACSCEVSTSLLWVQHTSWGPSAITLTHAVFLCGQAPAAAGAGADLLYIALDTGTNATRNYSEHQCK